LLFIDTRFVCPDYQLDTEHLLIQIIVRKSFSMDISDTQKTIVQLIGVIILYIYIFAIVHIKQHQSSICEVTAAN